MYQVLNTLKCVNCTKVLSIPVILPCGHTICKSHTQVAGEEIICAKCGSRHPNKGFMVNEAVADLIAAQLNNFDFGEQHKETSKSCGELKKQLDKNDRMFNDLDYFVHELIEELKIRVFSKREQLKLRIDQITQELIDNLDEYEKRCKMICEDKDSISKVAYSLMNTLKESNEEAKKRWEEWSSSLNELKVDFDKWSKIKIECDKTLHEMCEKLKQFEKELFLNELDKKRFLVECFEKANIDPVLKTKMDSFQSSLILNSELSNSFFELCKFKFNEKQELKLLYRASRDGFGAADFHSKCDNQVTFIKTTKGYIFGGYTQISWHSENRFSLDSYAFLFSLVNKFKKPFICKIVSPEYAIRCQSNYGPIFGNGNDINICDNSNTSTGSYLRHHSYEKPEGINDPNGYYFCDTKNFQVSEIEVYQIEKM